MNVLITGGLGVNGAVTARLMVQRRTAAGVDG